MELCLHHHLSVAALESATLNDLEIALLMLMYLEICEN